MEAYPRKQRLALLVVLLVVTTAWWMAQWWPAASVGTPILTAATTIRTAAKAEESRNSRPAPAAFAFNPNTVTAAELQQLGLSAKQAASWLKFRGERTDAFRSPEDISQLFVLSEDDKARLIPLAYVTAQPRVQGKDKVQGFAFDPNTVSSRDLQRLGLSPKQAAAWLKFRGDRRRAFRTPEDIRKLFVLSDKDKDRLVALATVPASSNASQPAEGVARQRFSFDPNTISTDSLQLLGFPRWQAEAFGRYRGGRATTFRRATDLLRWLNRSWSWLPLLLYRIRHLRPRQIRALQQPTPTAPKHRCPLQLPLTLILRILAFGNPYRALAPTGPNASYAFAGRWVVSGP